ncbi:hypothetical protein C2E23DRAFT_613820 [Lenzites betulinus]|nr:hypothetical protein C2E23DRAFT_613820 [Lenzites betulinus]
MSESERFSASSSSSPSLAPVDSSPPSSPSPFALCTPPASPGAKDPFAGSTKSSKRPRVYERNDAKRLSANIQPFKPTHPGFDDAHDALTRVPDIADATPTRVIDPFSASADRAWRPPTYEKKKGRVLSTDSVLSASSSTSCAYGTKRGASPTPASRGIARPLCETDDDITLSDDEFVKPKTHARHETKEDLERRLWDEAITTAIDKGNGVIDLAGVGLSTGPISYIPPSIADLEGFVVLSPTHAPISAPSSPKHSTKQLPHPVVLPYLSSSTSRAFTRATTLPAGAFNEFFLRSKDGERIWGTPAARAASLQSVPQPSSTSLKRRDIKLFLANNTIHRIPSEVFRVSSLTVLSLRSNALTTIPPQISQLTSLQELNIAQNNIRWIPAEMLNMRLVKLVVTGNPWLPPPISTANSSRPRPPTRSDSSVERRWGPVSLTTVHFTIPPLTELCFRVLFAPYSTQSSSYMPACPSTTPATASTSILHPLEPGEMTTTNSAHAAECPRPPRPLTLLEAAYALPLTEDLGLGPAVLATFRACVPAAVAKPPTINHLSGPAKVRRDEGQQDVHSSQMHDNDVFGAPYPNHSIHSFGRTSHADEDEPSISVCPSPAHCGQTRTPVFVRPAEERFTWEEVVAGVRVGGEGVGGVGVPVRWRGCGHGCLAFLDPEPEPTSIATSSTSTTSVRDPADVPAEDDVDIEMSEGGSEVDMQEVRFEGGLADPDDFEEGF